MLVVYPFFHTAGLKSGVLAAFIRGVTLVPHAVFDVRSVVDRVAEERITVLPGPPSIFQSILTHPDFASFPLDTLRLSVTGAAVVPVELIARMKSDLRLDSVITAYGLTETHGTVTICEQSDTIETIATTVGHPLDGLEPPDRRRRRDRPAHRRAGRGAGPGLQRDERVLQRPRGDGGGRRLRRLAAHRRRRIPRRGRLSADRRPQEGHLHRGGVQRLGRGGGVDHPCAATTSPRSPWWPRPTSAWARWERPSSSPAPGPTPTRPRSSPWCREHMANFKAPRYVHLVDALPTTSTGKVQKPELRTRAAELARSS